MSDDDENQPPPPPLPPDPPETRMEASIRHAMEAIERLAAIQASQAAGGSPPRDTQSVVEIVRDSKDPIVIKSLNDNNYTVLETGWIGDSRHYHHTDSRHHNRGFIPIDHLPDNNEFEIRLKARHLIEFHRTRGRKITVAETHLPEDGYVPTYEQRSHPEQPVFRLPHPPRRGTSYSELQRKESSAANALSNQCWDPRWSWSYNVERLMLILSTHFKQVIRKFRSYGSYIRGTNSHFYIVEHFRIKCWKEATFDDSSQYVIPYRDVSTHSSATRQSATTMKHVDLATYQAYHNCDNEDIHQEFTKDLPESMVTLLEARYGAEVADMCLKERSSILPQFRDKGYERVEYTSLLVKDEVLDGIEYKRINTSFERSNVLSEVEWNILSNVMGDIALSYTEQRTHHRRELRVYHELHNMERDNCDNFFYEIINVMKVRLKESHTKKVTILETLFDDMLSRYDATCHRISHLIQGLLDVNSKILEYGDPSNQRSESDLHKSLLLKLKVWYSSVPKDQETALSDEYTLFVKQLKFMGTRHESKIDDMYKPAMLDLHALLQLSVDLEAEHEATVMLPKNPPIFFTVDYSGINDEPSHQEAQPGESLRLELHSTQHEITDSLDDTEQLFKVTGASGRKYNFPREGIVNAPRPPPRHDERGGSATRGGHFSGGRKRPDSGRWNQQLSYYSNNPEQSRGGGSSTSITRSASPYRSSDSRRNVTDALSNYRDRRMNSNFKPQYNSSRKEPSRQTPSLAVSTKLPIHKRKEWLPKPAWTACKQIVEKSDLALQTPTDTAKLASVLREIKSHAASCLLTCEPPPEMMQPSSGASSQGSETDGYETHHVYDRNEEVEVEDVEDDTPNEELQTLTTKEQAAFNAAHQQMMMVGYENVTQQEQCDIVEALMSDMNLMMYDDESDNEMPGLEPGSDSDSDDEGVSGRALGDPPSHPKPITHTYKDPYSFATTADTLNLRLLSSAKVTSTLLITLLGSGLSVEQICAIYDTGASKPFVKTVKECIKGILIQLPKASSVTTATSNATAASMSLRRYNFAITTEMREEAQRYDIDFKDADVITLLAAPLVCADFQHDFDIVSGAVFKDIGAVIHQERWHTGKEFLSFHDTPNIRSEMGRRQNGLPFLRLVPDQFVIDNNLKRIHHHTLMPYNEAEGLRLLRDRWHIHDPKGVFVTALDQCMTLAYTGTLSPPISTKKSQEDIVDDDETQDSASPDQDHGGVTPLSQPAQDVAHSNTTPIASPRFGNPQSRSAPGHHSQRHSKSVSFVDKSKRRSLSIPPKRRSLSIPPIANETPSSSDGYASGTVESSFPLESEVHSLSESAILTVTLICAGLSTPVFFSQATTDTTKSNQFHRLPIKVKNIVESKSDLTDFALSYQKDIRIFNCLRKLVLALESGALTREELYTAIVEGTCPCYAETTMADYNGNEVPHPDADLFLEWQYRFLKIMKPECFLCEMTPPHSKSSGSHDKVVRQLEELGYHVQVVDRLPSCFCGDYTHRDRWFALAFLNPGLSFNIFKYCTKRIRPVSDVLDPVESLDRNLLINEKCTFRIRGHDTYPWGDDYLDNPMIAGQYISRSTVAGYINESHDKEDKFYSIESPLPTVTRNGIQLHDTRISRRTVRWATLNELSKANNHVPEQISFLRSLPLIASLSRLANAVPCGMLHVVYRCIIDNILKRRAILGVNGYTIDAQQSPPSEVHISLNSENTTSPQTYDDTRTCLPSSFFRFSLFSDDDSELLHSEASDIIFSEEQELMQTTEHVHDIEKVQNSWRPPDGIIDPDEIVSESHDEIPLRVTAKYDRKSVVQKDLPLYRPPSKEYYAAKRRMDNWHQISHIKNPYTIEHLIQTTRGHGLKPGDSRYLSPCDICDRNIDSIPRTHKSPHEGLRSAPPGTLPGEKWLIDGGDATVRSKWGKHRYFLVCICAVSSYPVVVYMKDQSARSFVTAIQYLDRLVRVRLNGRKITNLYGDFFSSHLDQSVFGVVRAEMGIEFQAAPPHMHWLNGYAEGFIRILKIATRVRLANLIGKYIDGELIKDATPWWPFAMEHARQCKAAEPSSSMTKSFGIVATREQLFLSNVDTPTELNIHPFGETCYVIIQKSSRYNSLTDTAEKCIYICNAQYNPFSHLYANAPQAQIVLRPSGRLQITGRIVFPYLRKTVASERGDDTSGEATQTGVPLSSHQDDQTSSLAPRAIPQASAPWAARPIVQPEGDKPPPEPPPKLTIAPPYELAPTLRSPRVTTGAVSRRATVSTSSSGQRQPVVEQAPEGIVSAIPARRHNNSDLTGNHDMGVRDSRSSITQSARAVSHQATTTPDDTSQRRHMQQQWQSLTGRQPHDVQPRSQRFAPSASPSPSVGESSSSIVTHFGVGRRGISTSGPITSPPVVTSVGLSPIAPLPPRPTPTSSAPLTSSAAPLPPAPPGLRRSSRLAGTVDLSKQSIHETGLSVAVTGGDDTLCASLPLETVYYTTEYDARRFDSCLHTAEPEMVVPSSMAEWFDKTVTMLFTDHLRWTPEIYQRYTDRHLYHTESRIPNSSQSDGIGMSRVSDNYGSGYDFDDSIIDAMFIQWMNIEDPDSIVLVTEDGLTHEVESHKLVDLKKVPREQHPYMIAAASKEIGDLIKIGTFATEPSIPSDRKAIDSRIVFKVKYRANGEFDKYKARLVAKGYLQRLGFDFFSTFSPMATLTTVRTVFAIAVKLGLRIHHADIPQAFTQAHLDEDIWLRLPPGNVLVDRSGKTHNIVKLLRALYGLRQSPQKFNKELVKFLVAESGFSQTSADSCLFYLHDKKTNDFILVASEVDDLIITGTNDEQVATWRKSLEKRFGLEKDKWEDVQSFLGINISYDFKVGRFEMDVSQKVTTLLAAHSILNNVKPQDVPINDASMDIADSAAANYSDTDRYIVDHYPSIVGSCIYISITCRPDIAFAVGKCARGMHSPLPKHVAMLRHLIGYLRKTKDYKLLYCRNGNASDGLFSKISESDPALSVLATSDGQNVNSLVGLSDANFANLTDEQRKSISGFAFYVFGCCVTWRSKLQTITAGSTHEAEIIAIALAANEGVWIRKLLLEIGFAVGYDTVVARQKNPDRSCVVDDESFQEIESHHDRMEPTGSNEYQASPFPLLNDNLGATQTVNNPTTSVGSRHLDLRYFRTREYIKSMKLTVSHISTKLNVADLFTKPLIYGAFSLFRNFLGIVA